MNVISRGSASEEVGRQRWAFAVVMLLAVGLWLGTAPGTRAAGATLSAATVSPSAGTIATTFTFTVNYQSDQGFAPGSVWAAVAGTTVGLALVSGAPEAGTWQGASTLPAGTWDVTFRAMAVQGPQVPALPGPQIVVTAPQPTPSPPPTPTPVPTTLPTPTQSPDPTATPPPGPTTPPAPTATPRPPGTPGPNPTPVVTISPRPLPGPPQPSSGPGSPATPPVSPSATASSGSAVPSGSAGASPSDAPAVAEPTATIRESVLSGSPGSSDSDLGPMLWVILGAGMSLSGAALIGWQYRLRQARRRS